MKILLGQHRVVIALQLAAKISKIVKRSDKVDECLVKDALLKAHKPDFFQGLDQSLKLCLV